MTERRKGETGIYFGLAWLIVAITLVSFIPDVLDFAWETTIAGNLTGAVVVGVAIFAIAIVFGNKR